MKKALPLKRESTPPPRAPHDNPGNIRYSPRPKANPASVSRQGRTIALCAIVREPASVRTGRALTGASRRIFGNQGGIPQSRPTGGFVHGGKRLFYSEPPPFQEDPAGRSANRNGGPEMRLELRRIFSCSEGRRTLKTTRTMFLARGPPRRGPKQYVSN